jgi:SH3-like domain-containing protein
MKTKGMRGAALAAALALLPAAAMAQAERKCEMDAYTIDEDPKGINVRAGASTQAKVVGVIPVKKDQDIGVSIVAENQGWFRIKGYHNYAANKDVKLGGWIHGSRLGMSLQMMESQRGQLQLREEPSERAKTPVLLKWEAGEEMKLKRLTAELPGGKSEVIDWEKIKGAATAVLLGCQGDWVRIKVHKYEGWVHGNALCGSPVTTCN